MNSLLNGNCNKLPLHLIVQITALSPALIVNLQLIRLSPSLHPFFFAVAQKLSISKLSRNNFN